MAMSVTGTWEHNVDGTIVKYTMSWTSASDGTATFTTPELTGTIVGVTFDPTTAAPTANYDVTLSDENGVDVLAGQGANLSATVSTRVCPSQPMKDGTTTSTAPIPIHGTLDLSVSNAGDTKSGKVILYLR